MKVTVLVAPELKNSSIKAAEYLKNTKYDGLFLPFPKGLEEYVAQFGEGLPYEYLIRELRHSKLIPEPIGAWEFSAEPLLRVLPQIKLINTSVQVYCYGDPLYSKHSVKIAIDITILVLANFLTERVDTEKWRKVLREEAEYRKEALRREVDFVAMQVNHHEKSICISGFDGEYIVSQLKAEGYDASLRCLDPFYYPTPLENLKRELNEGDVPDEKIRKLVLWHAKYIRDYVMPSRDLDEAYQKWVNYEVHRVETLSSQRNEDKKTLRGLGKN